jgi:Flp pilus assembly protein CpaB
MRSIGAPTLLAVRARRLATRRRWRRAFVAAVVVVTAAVVAAQFRAAEAARRRWDGTREVVVARRDLGPGEVVAGDTVELREVAAGSVAPAALDVLPVGSVVRYPVAAGEPLVASRLAPDGLTGLAALVPAGDRAVAVPVGPAARPPLRVGDHVDVLAVGGPTAPLPGAAPGVVPLVARALVVDVADDVVTVAVPSALTPAVAAAVTQSAVVLTLTGA